MQFSLELVKPWHCDVKPLECHFDESRRLETLSRKKAKKKRDKNEFEQVDKV